MKLTSARKDYGIYGFMVVVFLAGTIAFFVRYGTIVLRDAAQTAGGRPHHPKGGETMRITLHIGSFTVTIIVKSRNRHSAK